jgi:hypothetical protein
MDADQRVKGMRALHAYMPLIMESESTAAIAMTLCELQTAEFHSIPLECEVFMEEGRLSDRAPHGICVEWVYLSRSLIYFTQPYRALSRSTQSWASYSGYLREIRMQILFQNCFSADCIVNSAAVLRLPAE